MLGEAVGGQQQAKQASSSSGGGGGGGALAPLPLTIHHSRRCRVV